MSPAQSLHSWLLEKWLSASQSGLAADNVSYSCYEPISPDRPGKKEKSSETAHNDRAQWPVVIAVTILILVLTRMGLGHILVPGDR